MISITINNINLKVPKTLTILQACAYLNIEIPRFCFQNNLKIAGNCRMCLVELENSPKPVAACAMPVSQNMKIFTNTPLVKKARESVLEFLLLNHPLDCPICDQASECDLQDQTLNFGSDRSRFFLNKRGVEDKNLGPFIKTIMTRCIHCTRCVRFADEICNIDNLGVVGRGNRSEISFYFKNVFLSEFSGNLIDLCPVGALTSKIFTFKARNWELKRYNAVDVLDGIGSNLNIDIFNNKIIRILPSINFSINKEWITDKTRFFFDSLNYQRLEFPLLKDKKGVFKKISWFEAFNLVNQNLIKTDPSRVKCLIGNLTDFKSIYFLKKNLIQFGISSYDFENNFLFFKNDFVKNYLFNDLFKAIEKSDLCFIINSNIRKEGAIYNLYLLDRFKKGNFEIYNLGPKLNFTYPVENLGTTFEILIKIIQGKHSFCKNLNKKKKISILIGTNILTKKNGFFLIEKLKNISIYSKINFNLLQYQTSYINFLENFSNNLKNKKNANFYDLIYLYNTHNMIEKNYLFKKNKFIIYQGHHFTEDAQNANLILPGLTFLEKKGIYINTQGQIQRNNSILKLIHNQKPDSVIFKNLYFFLKKKNSNKIFLTSKTFNEIYPYLKKKLKISNFYMNNKKMIKVSNFYLGNINNKLILTVLERYSKNLVTANYFFKNNSNFNL